MILACSRSLPKDLVTAQVRPLGTMESYALDCILRLRSVSPVTLPLFEGNDVCGSIFGGRENQVTKLFAVSILLLAAVVSSAQSSKPESEEARQVTALENAWNQAEIKADVSGLNLLLGDEFVYTDVDGSLKNRAQWLAAVHKEALRYEQLGNQDQVVHVYGGTAIVTGVYRERVQLKGKSVVRRGRFTDTWFKQNGTWKCVASQSTLITP